MELGTGGGIVAFTGDEPFLAAWKQFFDRSFAQRLEDGRLAAGGINVAGPFRRPRRRGRRWPTFA